MTISIHHLYEQAEWIPTLAKWFQNEWGDLNPNATYQSRVKDLSQRTRRSELPLTIVAMENKQLLGSYSLEWEDMHTHSDLSPWLASVYVNPEFRKRGIGTFLVKNAIARSKTLNIPHLYLYTPHHSDWYAAMGWRELEKTKYHGKLVTVMQYP